MSDRRCCEWFAEQGALAVRDGLPADLDPELRLALAECSECQAALRGAGALRSGLAAWSEPEAPDDLVERSLAAIALRAALAPAEAGSSEEPAAQESPSDESAGAPHLTLHAGGRRRTTVIEMLVTPPLSAPPEQAPSRGRLLLRIGIQAAAAVLLFGLSSVFVAVFYPAVTLALEEREHARCQEHLSRLHAAALRYRQEHPEGPALEQAALRKALIEGGYANELDFVCPSAAGRDLGQRSYVGLLPAGVAALQSDQVLFHDRFANHSSGFNVVTTKGHTEFVAEESLAGGRLRRRLGPTQRR